MVIWSGWGFLVAIICLGSLVLLEYVTETVLKDDSYYQTHGWPKLAGFLLAAILTWILSMFLDKKKAKVMIDKETENEIILRSDNSLFFIPVHFWPYIFIALGVFFALL